MTARDAALVADWARGRGTPDARQFLAANVHPANLPGAGGEPDLDPPGWDAGCRAEITAEDAAAIAAHARGERVPVVNSRLPEIDIEPHRCSGPAALGAGTVPGWIFADSNRIQLEGPDMPFVRGVVLIDFKRGTTRERRMSVIESIGGTLIGGYPGTRGGGTHIVRFDDDAAHRRMRHLLDTLRAMPDVEMAGFELSFGTGTEPDAGDAMRERNRPRPQFGDADGDGRVTAADVELARAWAAGTGVPGPRQRLAANVHPANLPGAGGEPDEDPPGWDAACRAQITAEDVAAIDAYVRGERVPIVGEPLPDLDFKPVRCGGVGMMAPDTVPSWIFADSNRAPVPGVNSVFLRRIALIGFLEGTTRRQKAAAIALIGGTLIGGYRVGRGGGMYVVRFADDQQNSRMLRVLDSLEALPQVELAIFDFSLSTNVAPHSSVEGEPPSRRESRAREKRSGELPGARQKRRPARTERRLAG